MPNLKAKKQESSVVKTSGHPAAFNKMRCRKCGGYGIMKASSKQFVCNCGTSWQASKPF